jgi:tRNA threonylcarbamoyladenosine biosynthesis protein TsaE
MRVIEFQSGGLDATSAFAGAVAAALRPRDSLFLSGDLGAGKTTFTRALVAALGGDQRQVASPTFVLVHEYELAAQPRGIRTVVHVDPYRLTSRDDLDALGWDQLFEPDAGPARDGFAAVIEWPERLGTLLPAGGARIGFTHTGEESRVIRLEVPDTWEARPEVAAMRSRPPRRCPVTGAWVLPTSPTYPFGSEKARMADLGRWFSGSYTISRPLGPSDLDDLDAGEPG